MRVTASEGKAYVAWNDQGQNCELNVQGMTIMVDDDQTLRDLHACLDFLFGRPK